MELTDLDIIIARINDTDQEIQLTALRSLQNLLAASHGTVGIRQQDIFDRIEKLEALAERMSGLNQKYLYDLLSIMNLFNDDQKVLKYRIRGMYTDISLFGLQYVRKLVSCILDVIYQKLETEDYSSLIVSIVEFLFQHNSEVEAIDFIIEVSFLQLKNDTNEEKNRSFAQNYTGLIKQQMDSSNRDRILLYLEEMDKFYHMQDLLLSIYSDCPSRYLVYLLRLNRKSDSIEYVKSIADRQMKMQCMYILARNGIYFEQDDSEFKDILSNSFLSENFNKVAESLELLPPQKMEYIFKSIEKEKIEAAAISNALIHFAYSRDPVFFPTSEDYKIKQEFSDLLKDHKSISVSASVGLIHSYSHERVLECYSSQIYENPEVGAVLALAIASQRHSDLDGENLNLLSGFLSSNIKSDVIAAMVGISIQYAASGSQQAYDVVFPLLSSPDHDIALFAIYVLGSIFATTGDEGVISSCYEMYNQLKNDTAFSNFAILGLGFIFMKCPHLATSDMFINLDKYCKILALGLMNIGSGSPTVVDTILTEAFTGDTDALLECIGLLSSCLVGLGDAISTPLLDRICNSSLLLDSSHLKNVFPLCLALLYASNPKSDVLDILEKSLTSGDSDSNALVALGIVGAGTKSARILRILETNFNNIYKDSKAASALILSQGLVNLGKGLFSLSPLFYEKTLVSDRGLIGLLSTITMFLDQSIYTDYSFLCYFLSSSISPKYVVGYEGTCRVGKPSDNVGLAGKPNKINGTVIHSLPVILSTGERAEVDDEVLTSYVEDVLVKKQ